METVGGLEDLGDLAIQFADDLVDGLFPRGVHVFAGHDGVEELPQRDLGHLQEAIGDLEARRHFISVLRTVQRRSLNQRRALITFKELVFMEERDCGKTHERLLPEKKAARSISLRKGFL